MEKEPEIRFLRSDFTSFFVLLPIVAFISLGVFILSLENHPLETFIICCVCALCLSYFGMRFFTFIRIGPQGIQSKSVNGAFLISWEDIGRYGVFLKGRYGLSMLPPEKYDLWQLWGKRWLFVAKEGGGGPSERVLSEPTEDYIDFHYRRKALEVIDYYLERVKEKKK